MSLSPVPGRDQHREQSLDTQGSFNELNLMKEQTTLKTNLMSMNVHPPTPPATHLTATDTAPSKSVLFWFEQLHSMEMA